LAALKADNHCQGVAKAAANPGKGCKAREAIEVMEQFEFCHRKSMAAFLPQGKKKSPRIYVLSGLLSQKVTH
jgi:hypothetical protein